MYYQPGDTLLQKYRIVSIAGQGAFSEVYCALDTTLNVHRALKVLRSDTPGLGSTQYGEYQNRFMLEAQLGARLNHPHVIQVYDYGKDGENLVLVMEYAPGGNLGKKIEEERLKGVLLPIPTVLNIVAQVANGLTALHNLDVVHRDLKPNNILFDAEGRAKVADFGLAQIPGGPSQRSQLSSPQSHPGTPGYMSPEQNIATQYLTPASDIYGLGLVLFEMLTGRMYAAQRPGSRASALRPEIPAWLDNLILQMLDDDPRKRPWNGKELAVLFEKKLSAQPSRTGPVPVAGSAAKKTAAGINGQKGSTQKEKGALLPWVAFFSFLGIAAFSLLGLVIFLTLFDPAPGAGRQPTATQPRAVTITPTKRKSLPTNTSVKPAVATRTPQPTSQKTPTKRPPTQQPVSAGAASCTLSLCDANPGSNVCVYGFAPSATSLIVTFKFSQPVGDSISPTLKVGDKTFGCEVVTTYPDRLYCSGTSIKTPTAILSLYNGANLLCSGEMVIPRYVTPVPTKKKSPGNSYP